MRIDGLPASLAGIEPTRNTSQPTAAAPTASTSPTSMVDLSSRAQAAQALRDAVIQAPSLTSSSRLDQLKAQVQSGTYHVDTQQLAQSVDAVLGPS